MGTLSQGGYYVGPVTVIWSVTDPESVITATSGCATSVLSASTAGTILTCSATSAGGTATQATKIKLRIPGSDTTAPTITPVVSGTLGLNGWYVSDVSLSWTVSDPDSALIEQSGCEPTLISGDTPGTTYTCIATSAGGTASQAVTLSRDATAPETTLTNQPPNPATSQTASFTFTSSEPGSSFACKLDLGDWTACVSPVTYSNLALTAHTVLVRATDLAGNLDPTPASFSWTINPSYAFSGFFAPINNLPTINRIKAGSVVPLQFSVGGNYGLAIFAPGYPRSEPVACNTGPLRELVVDKVAEPEHTFLLYIHSIKRYLYLWKTDAAWAGSCRQLVVKLNDGSPAHVAAFKFMK